VGLTPLDPERCGGSLPVNSGSGPDGPAAGRPGASEYDPFPHDDPPVHGVRYHSYELGYHPNGPHSPGGWGLHVNTLPEAFAVAPSA
jgi:hypothetical protein